MFLKMIEADLTDRINRQRDTINAGNDQEEPQRNLSADGESATQQVLGRIFSVPSDSMRVVMLLNDADLKDRYLSSGGEKKVVDAATDEQIASMFPHANYQVDGQVEQEPFVYLADDFDLSVLDKGLVSKRPYAVLFNVPRSIAANLKSESPADIAAARETLLQIISHKHYVATLNASAIRRSNVGPLDDRDEREEKFNIKKFVTAYPVRAVINDARAEQEERDEQNRVTPDNAPSQSNEPEQRPRTLTAAERMTVGAIATEARRIFNAAAAVDSWPTTPEGLKELREKLVNKLTKDPRIGDKKYLIPAIVKSFYNGNAEQVKKERRYPDLLELLKDDADFQRLASGEAEEGDEQTAEPASDEPSTGEPSADATPPTDATPAADKTPDEIAAEIEARGGDVADEVAKILARRTSAQPTPEPAAEPESEMPEELRKEVDRLKKIKQNAINPKQREKAAADLATLLHRHEEQKKKAKRR